ncbi:MAG: hypothetical protein SAK29_30325 [Scytonema sp. PMC 1069.18]|nr:hypothetical protein [Scytonema sp. PMC 1069.18]MEC4881236.1 hypothetical protein [Scytonema sp. PMC 1070.18]
MSYVSLLKNVPEFLSQPTGIAIIASLGIHGAIAFLMPLMPIDSKTKKEDAASKKTVGVVELNQAEQSRLPQSGTSQLALAPQTTSILPQVPPANFANQPSSLPPLPPAPPAGAAELSLPPLPKSTNVSIAALPKSQSLRLISSRNLPSEPSLNANVKPFTPYVEKVRLGQPKPLETAAMPYRVPPIQAADIAQQQEMINTEGSATIPPTDQMPVLPGGNPVTQTTQPGSTLPNGAREQLVTPVGERPEAGDNTIALATQNLEPIQRQDSAIQVPGLPSVATQQLITKTTSTAERFIQVKEQYPSIETRQSISETVTAKAGQEGNVEGDLIINKEGQVEAINFNNNSVSSDQKAAVREYFREYFQKNPVQANGKPKYYPFNISLASNSNVRPETIQELSPSSQPLSESQRTLVQRLRSKVNTQPSKEPQKDNISQGRSREAQSTQAPKPEKNKLTERLRSLQVNHSKPTQGDRSVSATPVTRQQTSEVVIKQSEGASQNNQQQISRQQAVIRKTESSPEANSQQQTSRQEVVIKKKAPFANQQASRPEAEEDNNNKRSSTESSQKLLQQLRAIREQRQNSN